MGLDSCNQCSRRHEFLHCQRERVKKGLHWGLAEAPAALMWAPLIVVDQPSIEICLQLVDCAVDLLAEGHPVEFVQNSAMEALANAVRWGLFVLVRLWSISSMAR